MKTFEIKIRLPEDIHKKVKELAEDQGRSMNKQIIQIIKQRCNPIVKGEAHG